VNTNTSETVSPPPLIWSPPRLAVIAKEDVGFSEVSNRMAKPRHAHRTENESLVINEQLRSGTGRRPMRFSSSVSMGQSVCVRYVI